MYLRGTINLLWTSESSALGRASWTRVGYAEGSHCQAIKVSKGQDPAKTGSGVEKSSETCSAECLGR